MSILPKSEAIQLRMGMCWILGFHAAVKAWQMSENRSNLSFANSNRYGLNERSAEAGERPCSAVDREKQSANRGDDSIRSGECRKTEWEERQTEYLSGNQPCSDTGCCTDCTACEGEMILSFFELFPNWIRIIQLGNNSNKLSTIMANSSKIDFQKKTTTSYHFTVPNGCLARAKILPLSDIIKSWRSLADSFFFFLLAGSAINILKATSIVCLHLRKKGNFVRF